jgi:hypothetical protein
MEIEFYCQERLRHTPTHASIILIGNEILPHQVSILLLFPLSLLRTIGLWTQERSEKNQFNYGGEELMFSWKIKEASGRLFISCVKY